MIKTLRTAGVLLALASPAYAAGPEIIESVCLYAGPDGTRVESSCTMYVYANATSVSEDWQWENGYYVQFYQDDDGITLNNLPAESFDPSQIMDVEAMCYRQIGPSRIYCWGV